MLVTHCFTRVRSIFLAFIGIFRRALCCFSRRRRNSFSDTEQLDSVNVVSNTSPNKFKNVVSNFEYEIKVVFINLQIMLIQSLIVIGIRGMNLREL